MGYRTPNIDRLADEGMRFTDSYGEQSCTAGRAAFITGQSVFRTGLSKVGLPGADLGLQAEDPTIPELLKPLGYATGQFGKNHLGDKDEFLPTAHGFDEFFGNLYHLNAEGGTGAPRLPTGGGLPELPRAIWSARRHPLLGQPGRHPADRRHRPAHEEADGDGRRRVPGGGAGFHRPPGGRGDAVLRLVQHHPHALSAPTPNRRASVRPGAGSPCTTTP